MTRPAAYRMPLAEVEIAEAVRLHDLGLSVDEIAGELTTTPRHVANAVRRERYRRARAVAKALLTADAPDRPAAPVHQDTPDDPPMRALLAVPAVQPDHDRAAHHWRARHAAYARRMAAKN